MYGIIINAVAVCVIVPVVGSTYLVIQYPCRLVIGLDSRLHCQCTTEHVPSCHTIQTLDVRLVVTDTDTILTRMRINETGTELNELRIHRVVHTSSETLIVRTCTLECTTLLEVVQTYIISIVCTTTTEVNIVVLADTCLEYLIKPVGIRVILELVGIIRNLAITTRKRCTRISGCLTQIGAVLICVHHIIHTARDNINTEVTLVVDLQRLILLTTLSRDDNHTVSSTRTVDSTSRSILQHLDCLDIIRREVADRSTHRHTVDDIQRSCATERTDTTDADCRICTRLAIRCNLHTSYLTFQHRGNIRVRYTLQFISVYNRYRTCQVGLLLSTITYDNHLLKHHGVGFHLDRLKNSASAYCDLAILITHIAYHKRGFSWSVDREITIKIGNHTRLCTLDFYGCTNEGFSILVNNLTTDFNSLVLLH